MKYDSSNDKTWACCPESHTPKSTCSCRIALLSRRNFDDNSRVRCRGRSKGPLRRQYCQVRVESPLEGFQSLTSKKYCSGVELQQVGKGKPTIRADTLWAEQPVVITLIRRFGCPLCRFVNVTHKSVWNLILGCQYVVLRTDGS